MTTKPRFSALSAENNKLPQRRRSDQPQAEKPGMVVLRPGKPKATFQWPPDCLWPFMEYNDWDSDA
jgi:hypothetical protein